MVKRSNEEKFSPFTSVIPVYRVLEAVHLANVAWQDSTLRFVLDSLQEGLSSPGVLTSFSFEEPTAADLQLRTGGGARNLWKDSSFWRDANEGDLQSVFAALVDGASNYRPRFWVNRALGFLTVSIPSGPFPGPGHLSLSDHLEAQIVRHRLVQKRKRIRGKFEFSDGTKITESRRPGRIVLA